MNVLIVDDQPDVVEGLKDGVKWKELPVKEIYCACSAEEARELLEKNKIHIVLCDIEMPIENGLELFSWMQRQCPEAKCIFLTSHADFLYAQKALKLGGFDYLVQPAPYEDIAASVLRAAVQIEAERKSRQSAAYGQYVNEYKETLDSTILREYLIGHAGDPDKLLRYFGMFFDDRMESNLNDSYSLCTLVYFHVYKKEAVSEKIDGELLLFILQNVLMELAAAKKLCAVLCHHEKGFFTACFLGEKSDKENAKDCFREFIRVAKSRMYLHIFACISERIMLGEAPAVYTRCREWMKECINRYDGVVDLSDSTLDECSYEAPDFAQCGMRIKTGKYKEAEELLFEYLEKLSRVRHLNRKILAYFQQDFLQMFFNVLHQNSVSAHDAFRQNYDMDLLWKSAESTREMFRLVHFCITYLEELNENGTDSPVKKACAYIQKNIHENITRSDIVKEVYVNADYLSRVFKKEMNISLKDYIISEKLKIAASMLSNTDLSVSIIAVNVGFTNFSYFAQVFKKFYQISPSEYREKKRGTGQNS